MTRLKTLVVALLAGLLLAGCASPPGSVAVRVGDQEVSVRRVEDTYSLLAQHPEVGSVSRASIAGTFVVTATLQEIADDQNITVTTQEVEALLAEDQLFTEVRKDPVGEEFVRELALNTVISNKLPGDWRSEMAKYDPQLNPRYGVWNPQTQRVEGFGVLAEPVGFQ